MTRIEHLFEPHIVQAVYTRIERETKEREVMEAVLKAEATNVISLSAYRQKAMKEGPQEVS